MWLYWECNYISIYIQESALVIWDAIHMAIVVANYFNKCLEALLCVQGNVVISNQHI
jgi:hypothetical protein